MSKYSWIIWICEWEWNLGTEETSSVYLNGRKGKRLSPNHSQQSACSSYAKICRWDFNWAHLLSNERDRRRHHHSNFKNSFKRWTVMEMKENVGKSRNAHSLKCDSRFFPYCLVFGYQGLPRKLHLLEKWFYLPLVYDNIQKQGFSLSTVFAFRD